MSDVKLPDLISNGDNKLTKEIIDTFSTNEKSISEISVVHDSNIPLFSLKKTPIWMSDGHQPRLDIDIDYAIELLKKEDQNINVYSHLQEIINKVLLEKPENPLKSFEFYSQMLKRSYIPKESYFEPIFVDNIYRDDCRKNLQMYECALKIQSEEQKHYNKNYTSTKKSGMNSEDHKTIDGHDFEVHVQNLWNVNYMFNKAGCGLPINEVHLLSLTMNSMARSNIFKNIRFWGKIFGIQNTYFIIECESTDVELHHKKLKRINDLESSSLHDKEKLNNVVVNKNESKQIYQFKLDSSSKNSKNEMESKNSSLQEPLTSSIKSINSDSDFTDELIASNDSWSSINKSDSSKTKFESSLPEKIPDEIFGTGANKNVYFVSNDVNTKFIELDSVRSQHITEARKIKRYFTGKLFEPINSFPKFKGLERDYLRAQIARISESTQICPQGYYVIDKREITSTEKLENQSSNSSDLTKIIRVDLIQNKNFKPILNKNLTRLNNWVHKNPRIQDSGIVNDYDLPITDKSITNEEYIEDDEYLNYTEDSSKHEEELFGNLKNDISVDNTPGWKGGLCSPFDPRNSCTMMKSHIWPGAYAVAYKLETDYVYIGWAQKYDSIGYFSNLIGELRLSNSAKENILLYQEHTELGRKTSNSKKHPFSIRKYRKSYKGSEKMLKKYTYDFN